jgi:hypothetical protein
VIIFPKDFKTKENRDRKSAFRDMPEPMKATKRPYKNVRYG